MFLIILQEPVKTNSLRKETDWVRHPLIVLVGPGHDQLAAKYKIAIKDETRDSISQLKNLKKNYCVVWCADAKNYTKNHCCITFFSYFNNKLTVLVT